MWKRYINRHCRNLLTALAMLWLVAGCAAAPESRLAVQAEAPAPAVEESYRQALDMMQAGQWPEARQRLEDLTAAHAMLAGPWLNLGIVYTRLGEPEAAEAAFRRSIENNPANAVAYNQLGIFYRRTNRLEAARQAYGAALEVAPDDPDTHWNLGVLHDVYLPDAQLALFHFERYRQLTGSEDPQLAAWINALQAAPVPADTVTAVVKP
jgi:Flp pilus assembly protein TadD